MFNDNCSCSIMMIPSGFKIRSKADVSRFVEKCMQKGNEYHVTVSKTLRLVLEKDKNGNVSISTKEGDLNDIFNPLLEIARTNGNPYKVTVDDCVWKYRKHINAKWFTERKEW